MNITTSETLVERVRHIDDQDAWDRLYQLYGPLVRTYAISHGCKSTLADDVVQLTFVSLFKSLPRFQIQKQPGRFRSFIYTIVKRRMADLFDDQPLYHLVQSDTEHCRLINDHEDSRAVPPGAKWDRIYENNLMAQAFKEVENKIKKNGDVITLEIFNMYVVQGFSAGKVRQKIFENYNIKINENKIYQDKSRVMQMWKTELQKIKTDLGE